MTKPPITSELDLLDPDIAEYWRSLDGSYYHGVPTMMQLARNMRELTEQLKAKL